MFITTYLSKQEDWQTETLVAALESVLWALPEVSRVDCDDNAIIFESEAGRRFVITVEEKE